MDAPTANLCPSSEAPAAPPSEASEAPRPPVAATRRMTRLVSVLAFAALLGGLALRETLRTTTPAASPSPAAATGAERGLRIVLRAAPHLGTAVGDTEVAADIEPLVRRLVDAGVTEVLLQCKQDDTDELLGGSALFPTDRLTVAPGYDDGRLGRLIDRLDAANIRVHGWVPAFNDEAAATAHPEWRAWTAQADGTREASSAWLCPRHPDAVRHEAEAIAAALRAHPRLAGVFTDFIRFDSDHACVCDRCLAELAERAGLASVTPAEIVDAGQRRTALWSLWTAGRAEAICDAVDAMRDAIDAVREDTWFGACVLPFSAQDYSFNTQSGQDFRAMARRGLDEIAVMGYWDDWWKSPEWLDSCIESAELLVDGECLLTCLVDGDMSVRRTCWTLDRVGGLPLDRVGFFHYGAWGADELNRIVGSRRLVESGAVPTPAHLAVAIRIDTEPDWTGSYDAVDPGMIERLVALFEAEGMHATFVTCGKLAEQQPEAIRLAAAHGHEIACHAYDHEQLDALAWETQVEATDRGLQALRSLDIEVVGFGAPRNSITEPLRDHLMDRAIAYDGSLAYDPLTSALDAAIHVHPTDPQRSIVTIPFIMPNDWDALRVAGMTPDEMLEAWIDRLDHVLWVGEPVFVIDVHQWLVSGEAEMDALRRFIRTVQSRPNCRFVTLREAAEHAARHVRAVERAAGLALGRDLR